MFRPSSRLGGLAAFPFWSLHGQAGEAKPRSRKATKGEDCKKDDDAMGRASLLRGGTCAGVGMGGVPGPRAEGPDQVLPQKSQEDAKVRLPLFPMEASSI